MQLWETESDGPISFAVKMISRIPNLDEVLKCALTKVRRMLSADCGCIALLTGEDSGVRVAWAEGECGYTSGAEVFCEGILCGNGNGHFGLTLPLKSSAVEGIICLGRKGTFAFSSEEKAWVTGIVELLVSLIDRCKCCEGLKGAAMEQEIDRLGKEICDILSQTLRYVNSMLLVVGDLLGEGKLRKAALEMRKLRQAVEEACISIDKSGGVPQTPSEPYLTGREKEILSMVARGATNREIAESLFLAQTTVKTHLYHLMNKLNLKNRAQVAAFAVKKGLV